MFDFRTNHPDKHHKGELNMKNQSRTYLILGIVFLAVGITILMTGALSRTMAYGDFVIALAFFALSTRKG